MQFQKCVEDSVVVGIDVADDVVGDGGTVVDVTVGLIAAVTVD